MKRKYYLLTLLLLLSLGSCKEFLDEPQPEDTLAPSTYYQTEAQLKLAVGAVYDILQAPDLYKTYIHYLRGWEADEGYNRASTLTTFTISYEHTASTSSVLTYWQNLYKGIARANDLLANVDNNTAISQAFRDQLRGEALFLRGYYYFLLAQSYGGVPLVIKSYTSIENTDLPRATLADTYAQILADMTAAEALVPKITALGYGGRVNKSAVRGILARVCLYMAGEPLKDVSKYADAKNWAKMVIDDAEAGHQLNPSYADVFIKIAQDKYDIKESIWEVEFYGNGSGNYTAEHSTIGYNIGALSPAYAGTGAAYIQVTGKLYDLYQPGDKRKGWNIQNFNYGATASDPKTFRPALTQTNKWAGQQTAKWRREYELVEPKGASFTPQNFALLRYSDVLLMYAEAENALNGPTPDAQAKVNEVRRRGFAVGGIKSFTVTNSGSGYITAPTVTITGEGGTGAVATATVAAGAVTAITLTKNAETEFNYGAYATTPTVTIAAPPTPLTWAAGTAYAVSTTAPVRYLNNLYRVTTAGTSTATPPTHTSGASTAASTGAVFTFLGTVNALSTPTATATLFTNADADVPSTYTVSKEKFLEFLQDERSRELCFESFRKFDLVRWGIFVTTMHDVANLAKLQGVTNHMPTWFMRVADKHVLYPIPAVELTLNKSLVQNPGW